VVNDKDMKMWKLYGSKHWPTVIIISPDGMILKVWDEIVPQKELETYLEVLLDVYAERLD